MAADVVHASGAEAAEPALLLEARKQRAFALVADEVPQETLGGLAPVRQERRQRPAHQQLVALVDWDRRDELAAARQWVWVDRPRLPWGELCIHHVLGWSCRYPCMHVPMDC